MHGCRGMAIVAWPWDVAELVVLTFVHNTATQL